MKVIGFGTFDGLHPGHIYFLRALKKLTQTSADDLLISASVGADDHPRLLIVVARDSNVLKIKGKKPKFNEHERVTAIQKTSLADEVILGNPNDFYECLRTYQPDIIGLGYDQYADLDYLKTHFPTIKIIRIDAFEPEKYKSSILNKNQ